MCSGVPARCAEVRFETDQRRFQVYYDENLTMHQIAPTQDPSDVFYSTQQEQDCDAQAFSFPQGLPEQEYFQAPHIVSGKIFT